MKLIEVEEIYLSQLSALYGKEEIKNIVAIAIQKVHNVSKGYYLLHKSEPLTLAEEAQLIRILDELKTGKPLQYVLGEAFFYGLPFQVNSSVLVPRPETEELVEWLLTFVRKHEHQTLNMLDIGTGSGCIAISIKKLMPDVNMTAMDISAEALAIARENAALNEASVSFLQEDICKSNLDLSVKFDIIVSNPPYVTESEKSTMSSNVLKHEPSLALFVPDSDALKFYKSIAVFAQTHLKPTGALFLEINERFGEETGAVLRDIGYAVELKRDMYGKERMIKATY